VHLPFQTQWLQAIYPTDLSDTCKHCSFCGFKLRSEFCCTAWSKVHPRTGHEDPEEEYKYSPILSLTSALDGVGGQRHAPAALHPGKTRYPLNRRLGRPHGRSGLLIVKQVTMPLSDLAEIHFCYSSLNLPLHPVRLTVWSHVVTLGATGFSIPKFYILPAFWYVLYGSQNKQQSIFSTQHKELVFTIQMECVYCAV
jgi:hypothetical protein